MGFIAFIKVQRAGKISYSLREPATANAGHTNCNIEIPLL